MLTELTYRIEYMIKVSIDTTLAFVSVIFHREPLHNESQ